jgi:formylglycine-generating enzyme required for sulfatase activity
MCVAETDLGKMTWYDAMEYCKINKDWRLPTRKELNQIYKSLHKKGEGGFENTYYWTIDELSTAYAWSLNFDTGVLHYYTKMHKNNIRLIKNGI